MGFGTSSPIGHPLLLQFVSRQSRRRRTIAGLVLPVRARRRRRGA